MNVSATHTFHDELSVLKMVTESLVSLIIDLTSEERYYTNKIVKDTQEPKENIVGIMNRFMTEFRNWQSKMEEKLAAIEAFSRKQSLLTTNLLQSYRPKLNVSGNSFPYYVLIGDQPTNLQSLNSVISSFYKPNNSSDGKIKNSPMVIKLVN